MEIDWIQLLWDGRWTALEMFGHALWVNVQTHWWFAPLLLVILISAGWKGIARLTAYVARVFWHTHLR